jgi:hypothetical protein
MPRFIPPVPGFVAAAALAVLAACGGDPEAERPAGFIAFEEPVFDCTMVPADPRQMRGAYLRGIDGTDRRETIILRGDPGRNALSPRVRVNEGDVRVPLTGSIGSFVNSRPATAEPIAALNAEAGGARAYVLSYEGDGLSYSGPAVVGEAPTGAEIPNAGQTVFTGPVALILTDAAGAETPMQAVADLALGYSSQTAILRIRDIVAPPGVDPGFTTLTWSDLGLCGTRLASTGRGSITAVGPTGRTATPFGTPEAPSAARSVFEGVLLAVHGDTPGPQATGGVFAILGDRAGLRGTFTALAPQ